tara:strand:- start:313 stop:477 length:165 start_codon:yes stop_codon:yes gene_type:complete
MSKLIQLQKNVEDAFNAYDAVRSDVYSIATRTAYDAWVKSRLELSDYLKEYGDV